MLWLLTYALLQVLAWQQVLAMRAKPHLVGYLCSCCSGYSWRGFFFFNATPSFLFLSSLSAGHGAPRRLGLLRCRGVFGIISGSLGKRLYFRSHTLGLSFLSVSFLFFIFLLCKIIVIQVGWNNPARVPVSGNLTHLAQTGVILEEHYTFYWCSVSFFVSYFA